MFDKFPQQFGPYVLLEKIGQGGMAEIFRATISGPGNFTKEVAIKRILPSLAHNNDFITQFLDEARIAGSLSHPNIVQIYNVDQVDDHYYIAMEYIRGEHLGQVIRDTVEKMKFFPFPIGVSIINQVAKALHFAHSATDVDGRPLHIIHRDVSPQNIMIALNGGVKLTDFGIAKAANRLYQTTAGVIKGKFSYLAPEQLRGAPASVSSDIFALGVVFWELLAGRRLFQSNSDIKTIQLVQACQIPPLTKIRNDIPEQLDQIVAHFLAPTPEGRYQNAAEIVNVLTSFLLEQGVTEETTIIANFMANLYGLEQNGLQSGQFAGLAEEDLKTEIHTQEELNNINDLETHILPQATSQESTPLDDINANEYLGEFEKTSFTSTEDQTERQSDVSTSSEFFSRKKSNKLFYLLLSLLLLFVLGLGGATVIIWKKKRALSPTHSALPEKAAIELDIYPPQATISLNGVRLKKGDSLGSIKYIVKGNGRHRRLEGLVSGIKYQIKADYPGYHSELRGIIAKEGDTYWMKIRLRPQKTSPQPIHRLSPRSIPPLSPQKR